MVSFLRWKRDQDGVFDLLERGICCSPGSSWVKQDRCVSDTRVADQLDSCLEFLVQEFDISKVSVEHSSLKKVCVVCVEREGQKHPFVWEIKSLSKINLFFWRLFRGVPKEVRNEFLNSFFRPREEETQEAFWKRCFCLCVLPFCVE